MNNVYCVCTTPSTYYSYVEHWNNFYSENRNLIFVSDNTLDEKFKVGFTYNENDVRKNLNFYKHIGPKHFWNSVGNRTIIWFYAHFRMLNFYLSNPNHDYYWFFDDDVKAQNWDDFFKVFENNDSDFISYFCFKNENVESQPDVPKIDHKTFSYKLWFERFPGDGDTLPENTNEIFGSFFPVVRLSKRALEELLKVNNEGYYGYSEGFVPTILNRKGFKLQTLIDNNDTSKHFNVDDVVIRHKNTKITWSWI
jgi:hypothetical protein